MERNTNTLYAVRFIAALVVVLFHYSPPGVRTDLTPLIKNGNEAVNIFFFISGFVLTVSNARFFGNTQSIFPKKEFYIKRIARIYPLYLLSILILLLFHYGVRSIDGPSVKYKVLFELVGVHKWLYVGALNYPDWSISCEIMFYLLFPFIAQYMRRHSNVFTWFVWFYYLVSVAATYMLYPWYKADLPFVTRRLVDAIYMNPLLLISVFMFGMLAGECFINKSISFFNRSRNSLIAAIVTGVVILLAKYYAPHSSSLLKGGLLAPVYFVFIMAITSFKTKHTKFITSRLFIFLGDISYGMYIMQYPLYVFYIHYIQPVATVMALVNYVVALICFASITHLFVEKPLRKVITSLYRPRPKVAGR
jgi:peptidoglycan/LPS O-acetylase OafA/YrhL